LKIDNNCNLWGFKSKIYDLTKNIYERKTDILYKLNNNIPVNVSIIPYIKNDLVHSRINLVPYYEYCPFEYINNK